MCEIVAMTVTEILRRVDVNGQPRGRAIMADGSRRKT